MARAFILDGKEPLPASFGQWAEWFERNAGSGNVVAFERELAGGASVSTIFVGLVTIVSLLDESRPPLLFESLVRGGEHDGHMRRYATWLEAEEGHRAIVKMVQRHAL